MQDFFGSMTDLCFCATLLVPMLMPIIVNGELQYLTVFLPQLLFIYILGTPMEMAGCTCLYTLIMMTKFDHEFLKMDQVLTVNIGGNNEKVPHMSRN